jgi:hypothetical protein
MVDLFKMDFDGTKFVKVSYEAKHRFDFSNEPDTNFVDVDGIIHTTNEKTVDERIEKNQNLMVKRLDLASDDSEFIIVRCKDCGKYFRLTKGESDWFDRRGLENPKRCLTCRFEKRKGNQK